MIFDSKWKYVENGHQNVQVQKSGEAIESLIYDDTEESINSTQHQVYSQKL